MKILLLTGMPPCKNYTAGLVLDQLCRFLPQGSVACFAVVNPYLKPQVSDDLDWVPLEYFNRPRETWLFSPSILSTAISLFMENTYAKVEHRKIVNKAIRFGKSLGVDMVWCVLEGQTMIRLARPVAKGLGVPLLTEVWDPPYWWLRENGVDKFTQSQVVREFERAIRHSATCAAASWAMAERYQHDYGVRSIPLIPSLNTSLALQPAQGLNCGKEFTIGIAGQIYASEEWMALVAALDSVNWKIEGKNIKIRILGRRLNVEANALMNVEFLGWATQQDTIKLMSEMDVLYCPYWFSKQFETESRLSFPSKLTTYLAAGRPVFFHGPEYASPARFLKENRAAVCCCSLQKEEIIAKLSLLLSDNNLYVNVAFKGSQAFEKYLSLSSMRQSLADFLQVSADFLVPLSTNE